MRWPLQRLDSRCDCRWEKGQREKRAPRTRPSHLPTPQEIFLLWDDGSNTEIQLLFRVHLPPTTIEHAMSHLAFRVVGVSTSTYALRCNGANASSLCRRFSRARISDFFHEEGHHPFTCALGT